MKPAQKSLIALFVISYATMFLFGLVENVKGVSFPLIKSEFGVAYDSQGGLVSLTWFGYVIFCLVASLFLHRFGIKNALLAGYALIVFGSVATLVAPTFWTVTLTLLVVNTGFGFFEIGNNALGTVIFRRSAALLMNLLHFFYGLGAILGPKTAGLLTDSLGLDWRQVYLVVLIPVVAVGLFVIATRFQPNGDDAEEAPTRVTFLQALRRPVVWLFCLALGFMEVIEFGAANWGGLYLKDVYGLDPRVIGASFVSLFYISFTVSRLFSGLLIERAGYMRSLSIALLASVALFIVGFALGERGIWILPLTGMFIAIMFPTMMAVGMQVFGKEAAAITSVIITVSGAINGIFQMVVGLTNQYAGVAWGYRSCILYAILAFVLLQILWRQMHPNTASQVAAAG